MSWDNNSGGDGGQGPPATRWVRIPSPVRNDGVAPEPQPIQRPPARPDTYGAGTPLEVAQPPPVTGLIRRQERRLRLLGLLAVVLLGVMLALAALLLARSLSKHEQGAPLETSAEPGTPMARPPVGPGLDTAGGRGATEQEPQKPYGDGRSTRPPAGPNIEKPPTFVGDELADQPVRGSGPDVKGSPSAPR